MMIVSILLLWQVLLVPQEGNDESGGANDQEEEETEGKAVVGVVTYDASIRTMRFIPTTPLRFGRRYKVQISGRNASAFLYHYNIT